MRWVKTADELPKENGIVLVAYKSTFPGSVRAVWWINDHWNTAWDAITTPDYWAPIAPLPKDGE